MHNQVNATFCRVVQEDERWHAEEKREREAEA